MSSEALQSTHVVVIGGGAAGLTAALFLARAGVAVTVVDQDRSILKRARVNNLPGSDGIEGRELLAHLRGATTGLGVHTIGDKADDVVPEPGGGFTVLAGETRLDCRYIVLATGQGSISLPSLPLETADPRQPFVKVNIVTDRWGATSVPGVWAAGVTAGWPSQAVICAGSGANVAIEIVTAVTGAFWVDHDDTLVRADAG